MCPAVLNHDILAFNKPRLTKTLFECRHVLGPCLRGCDTEKANHRHRGLLRASRNRPRRRRAAEKLHKLAPSHELPSEKADNLTHYYATEALMHRSAILLPMPVQGQNAKNSH